MIISDSVIAYPASLDKQSQSGATDLNKERVQLLAGPFYLKSATTYSPTCAVPSALSGLTSLFGMGRGGTLTL